jgi:hypothetical protein
VDKLGFSHVLALLGIVITIILVVLDKAGKLKNPMALLIMLFLASLLTLPVVLGNSWVLMAPSGILKLGRGILAVCLVGVAYSLLLIWIFAPNNKEASTSIAGLNHDTLSKLDTRISILERLQTQTSMQQATLEKNYPDGYYVFAGDKHTIYIPSAKKGGKNTRVFSLDWENSKIMYVDSSFVHILLTSFHYYPNEIQIKNLSIILERKVGAIADGIYFNNIGMSVELIDDKDDDIIYVIGFRSVKLIPKKREPKAEVVAFMKKLGKPIMSGINTNTQKYINIEGLAMSSGWTVIEY